MSDFGLTKTTDETGTFPMSGIRRTDIYLAPELMKMDPKKIVEERGNRASDVFALGCTFYVLLTRGIHPFGSRFLITANIFSGKYDLSSKLE